MIRQLATQPYKPSHFITRAQERLGFELNGAKKFAQRLERQIVAGLEGELLETQAGGREIWRLSVYSPGGGREDCVVVYDWPARRLVTIWPEGWFDQPGAAGEQKEATA